MALKTAKNHKHGVTIVRNKNQQCACSICKNDRSGRWPMTSRLGIAHVFIDSLSISRGRVLVIGLLFIEWTIHGVFLFIFGLIIQTKHFLRQINVFWFGDSNP